MDNTSQMVKSGLGVQSYKLSFNVKLCQQKIYVRFDATSFFAASTASIEAYQRQTMSKLGVSIKSSV